MPLWEIRQRFTLTEMVILSWRSQEQAYQLKHRKETGGSSREASAGHTEEGMPKNLPARFFNKDGELDLRGVSGRDAWEYFKLIGCPLPIIPRSKGR